ncbi:uncharacterized protein [Elaeis guineensis]|uniref:uncharacterized protein n=1 Tax=Elaeis guineensis var. tenera TaxID=51953 RepID=UPI003C6D5549
MVEDLMDHFLKGQLSQRTTCRALRTPPVVFLALFVWCAVDSLWNLLEPSQTLFSPLFSLSLAAGLHRHLPPIVTGIGLPFRSPFLPLCLFFSSSIFIFFFRFEPRRHSPSERVRWSRRGGVERDRAPGCGGGAVEGKEALASFLFHPLSLLSVWDAARSGHSDGLMFAADAAHVGFYLGYPPPASLLVGLYHPSPCSHCITLFFSSLGDDFHACVVDNTLVTASESLQDTNDGACCLPFPPPFPLNFYLPQFFGGMVAGAPWASKGAGGGTEPFHPPKER